MSAAIPTTDVPPPTQTERRCLIALLVLAAVLRLGVICWKPESLAEDRDLYWGIANKLVTTHTFANPAWGNRTAYRPPLYPLLLAGILWVGGGTKLLAVVHIGLGLGTVWLTWRVARSLGLLSGALVAAGFVAVNPLLIHMTALAMTETLCGFLLAALLCKVVERHRPDSAQWIGSLFGLSALCRPTVWSFAVLATAVIAIGRFRPSSLQTRRSLGATIRSWLAISIVVSVVIAPWVVRNRETTGDWIVTTTHGGYTLYLANNDAVYEAEVAHPTEEPWDSRAWQQTLPQPGAGDDLDLEVMRDRWMTQHAKEWIRQRPREFIELCWLRVKRFWSIFPGGTDAGSLPMIARWGIAVFFAVELLAAAIGLWRLRREEWAAWWPAVLLVVSFALVHVVYWSNLRMRAPVEPVLALLAARGFAGRWRK